jgi:alpha-glucosidase
VKSESNSAYLIGENFFDGTPTLQGDELDATMNYQGFNIPMWRWLAGEDVGAAWGQDYADTVPMPSEALAEQMAVYRAALPWIIASQQFNQLGSHDTSRILTIVKGNQALVKLGVFLLMTYPGVPCVYYGDEIGMEGGSDPDNRRTMVWDDSKWNNNLRSHYQYLIHMRKQAPALKYGGYQQVYAQGGTFAFQRQSADQRLIVVAHRGPETLSILRLPVRYAGLADGMKLIDLLSETIFEVEAGEIRFTNVSEGAMYLLEARQ